LDKVIPQIAAELKAPPAQVHAAVGLLDGGATSGDLGSLATGRFGATSYRQLMSLKRRHEPTALRI